MDRGGGAGEKKGMKRYRIGNKMRRKEERKELRYDADERENRSLERQEGKQRERKEECVCAVHRSGSQQHIMAAKQPKIRRSSKSSQLQKSSK